MSEAKNGEFTLVYNTEGKAHPVALTKDQHETLQLLLRGIGEIKVIGGIQVHHQSTGDSHAD